MIVELNEKAWTPNFALNHVCEIADQIENIAIAMKLKDGTTQTFTSIMSTETFALLVKRLDIRLHYLIFEDLALTQCPNGEGDVVI